jgi:hypothetical protein
MRAITFSQREFFKLSKLIHASPTAAARVRVRAACGVCGGQSGTGAGFLRVLQFPCQSFHRFRHYHNHPGLAQ